jgi:hypothetical protein
MLNENRCSQVAVGTGSVSSVRYHCDVKGACKRNATSFDPKFESMQLNVQEIACSLVNVLNDEVGL